jgi:hypothetical protein
MKRLRHIFTGCWKPLMPKDVQFRCHFCDSGFDMDGHRYIIINNFLFYVAPGTPIKEIPWPSTCRNTLWEEGATMKIIMLTYRTNRFGSRDNFCRFLRDQIGKPTTRGEKKADDIQCRNPPSIQGTGEEGRGVRDITEEGGG